jgi:hypothetical protein
VWNYLSGTEKAGKALSEAQQFDPWQWAGKHAYPASKKTRLAFEDVTRFTTQQHKQSGARRLATPSWALSDVRLRELIVAFLEERAGFRKQQTGTLAKRLERAKAAIMADRPRLIALLDKLCAEYVQLKRLGAKPDMSDEEFNATRFQPYMEFAAGEARYVAEKKRLADLQMEVENCDTFLRYTEADGGAATIAALIYYFYRCMYDSVGVSIQLNLKPNHCRQLLARLHETAHKLWPDAASVIGEWRKTSLFMVEI